MRKEARKEIQSLSATSHVQTQWLTPDSVLSVLPSPDLKKAIQNQGLAAYVLYSPYENTTHPEAIMFSLLESAYRTNSVGQLVQRSQNLSPETRDAFTELLEKGTIALQYRKEGNVCDWLHSFIKKSAANETLNKVCQEIMSSESEQAAMSIPSFFQVKAINVNAETNTIDLRQGHSNPSVAVIKAQGGYSALVFREKTQNSQAKINFEESKPMPGTGIATRIESKQSNYGQHQQQARNVAPSAPTPTVQPRMELAPAQQPYSTYQAPHPKPSREISQPIPPITIPKNSVSSKSSEGLAFDISMGLGQKPKESRMEFQRGMGLCRICKKILTESQLDMCRECRGLSQRKIHQNSLSPRAQSPLRFRQRREGREGYSPMRMDRMNKVERMDRLLKYPPRICLIPNSSMSYNSVEMPMFSGMPLHQPYATFSMGMYNMERNNFSPIRYGMRFGASPSRQQRGYMFSRERRQNFF